MPIGNRLKSINSKGPSRTLTQTVKGLRRDLDSRSGFPKENFRISSWGDPLGISDIPTLENNRLGNKSTPKKFYNVKCSETKKNPVSGIYRTQIDDLGSIDDSQIIISLNDI